MHNARVCPYAVHVAQPLYCSVTVVGNFFGLTFFIVQALKAYFCGFICPEHALIVAYCPRLLFECPDFHGFWGSP